MPQTAYNIIAHVIALLVFQSLGVPLEVVESMIKANEEMKYFLQTAYGHSKNFDGIAIELMFQGLCQGNGAAPAGWAVIIITILYAHKMKGHGGHFLFPISNLTGHLAALLFVDDTYLIHINIKAEETVTVSQQAMQDSISNWGQLLIYSGGAFKPTQCFLCHIHCSIFNMNL